MTTPNDAYWQNPPTVTAASLDNMTTGGNQPPSVMPTMNMSTPLPPNVVPTTMNTGGNLPAMQAPTTLDGSKYVANLLPGQAPGPQFSATNVALDSMDQMLGQDSAWMRNATRRGMDVANSRGVMNSNMAGGLAQRAAIEGAQPMFQEAMALHKAREGQAFQSQQSALDRIQVINRDMLGAELDEWKSSSQFTREFNGALSMLPIKNSMDLTNAVSQYAMENPELYTPEIVSGMSNFFNRNALSILQTYFPSMITNGGGG